jgi:hypothetical protein
MFLTLQRSMALLASRIIEPCLSAPDYKARPRASGAT